MTIAPPPRLGRAASAGPAATAAPAPDTPGPGTPTSDDPATGTPTDASPDGVQIADRQLAFAGDFRIHSYRLRHRLARGGWSGWITREVLERRPAVAVLLYDPFTDRIVLLRRLRLGALAAGKAPWQVELVAGPIGEGETPDAVARRAAYREAGAPIFELLFMHDCVVAPGASSERTHMYCALLDSRGMDGVHAAGDDGAEVAVERVSFARASTRLRKGEIESAAAILALHWLALHRGELRSTSRLPV